jgi:hypothetical protein
MRVQKHDVSLSEFCSFSRKSFEFNVNVYSIPPITNYAANALSSFHTHHKAMSSDEEGFLGMSNILFIEATGSSES